LTGDLQVVAQGMTHQNATGDWTPRLSRGFLRYSPSANVLLRAGRIGYDSYLLAESPDVGYSYLPIRPAPEFFGLFATDDIDGADVAVSRQVGGGIGRVRLFAGSSRGEQAYLPGAATATNSNVLGGQLDYSFRSWLLRLGAVDVSVRKKPDFSALAGALRATGRPQGTSLADALENDSRTILAYQLAVAYDGRPLQAQMLLTRVESDMVAAPKVNSGIVVFGYRYHRVTPFVSFAAVKNHGLGLPTGLPDTPEFAALNAAAHLAQTGAQATQRTQSAGIRFDVTPRLDLKFQVDRIRLHETNLIFNSAETRPDGASMTLFGLAADFLF
jgi:hypothetical protein